MSTPEEKEFRNVLSYVVDVLAMERSQDKTTREKPFTDLFEDLSPQQLLGQAQEIVAENGSAADVMPLLTDYGRKVEKTCKQLQTTFTYHNRLANMGTIAQKLVHEVGHNVSIIGAFLRTAREFFSGQNADRTLLQKRADLAERAVQALGRLAELFRPLASRSFARGKRIASIAETWDACIEAKQDELHQAAIKWSQSMKAPDSVRIDPGELWTVLFNLLDNAAYWLSRQRNGNRKILLETRLASEKGRMVCFLHDSGPGVERDEQDRIFLPGVTKRPSGFGMGLTLASEVVVGHGGKMGVKSPGKLGGATFRFDLPVAAR